MAPSSFNGVYRGKQVLVTGNTGFKGSWLTLWLSLLQANVHGYSLSPPTHPALFDDLHLYKLSQQEHADVMNFGRLKATVERVRPDIIFHLAAQSLVGESYAHPLETVRVNTLGSVHVMEAVRQAGITPAIVMVTSDKCYENREWLFGYREGDSLGGYDPYSASKGAAEILIGSWRNSFFNPSDIDEHGVRLASARAGNVIGGGDWARDRIVPDCIRALSEGRVISVRNPTAIRPWQHVLEPLHGYLKLGAILLDPSVRNVGRYCDAFNFGPQVGSAKPVSELVRRIVEDWGSGGWREDSSGNVNHEASLLRLSIDRASHMLNWIPRWDFDTTVRNTVEWYLRWAGGSAHLLDFTIEQIEAYEEAVEHSERVYGDRKESQAQV